MTDLPPDPRLNGRINILPIYNPTCPVGVGKPDVPETTISRVVDCPPLMVVGLE